jgi:hypothetical protein
MASILPTTSDCCDSCDTCDTSVEVVTNASQCCSGVFYRDTIAQMRAISSSDDNASCTVGGNAAAGDGGGGIYFWNPTATNADDGINFIRPDDYTTAGLWQKLL